MALEAAKAAGLSERQPLVVEARGMLGDLLAQKAADDAVAKRLESALESGDVLALETAVEACMERRLPLGGADKVLQRLRAETKARAQATEKLTAAMAAEDANATRWALDEARKAGCEAALLQAAVARIAEVEAVARRREEALYMRNLPGWLRLGWLKIHQMILT